MNREDGYAYASTSLSNDALVFINRPLRELCRKAARGEVPTLESPALQCPIQTGPVFKPVLDSDGHLYSAYGWIAWSFTRGGLMDSTSPFTRQRTMNTAGLVRDLTTERLVDGLMAKNLLAHRAIVAGKLALMDDVTLGKCLNAVDSCRQTALHLAVKYATPQDVERLLALGANADARDADGQTPLHVAVERQGPHLDVLVAKLGVAMTDRDSQDAYEVTPMHYIIDSQNIDAARAWCLAHEDAAMAAEQAAVAAVVLERPEMAAAMVEFQATLRRR